MQGIEGIAAESSQSAETEQFCHFASTEIVPRGILKSPACQPPASPPASAMRIFQDQLYQKGEKFVRLLRVERHEVEFRTTEGDPKGDGESQVLPKKEFCRLLKSMTLVTPPAPAKPDTPPV